MHIPGHSLQPHSVFDENRFESALKQMTTPPVSPVKPDAVAHIEPLGRSAEIGLRRFHYQVIMVVHQDVSMEAHSETKRHLGQQFQEMDPIPVLPKYVPPFVASCGDVI